LSPLVALDRLQKPGSDVALKLFALCVQFGRETSIQLNRGHKGNFTGASSKTNPRAIFSGGVFKKISYRSEELDHG